MTNHNYRNIEWAEIDNDFYVTVNNGFISVSTWIDVDNDKAQHLAGTSSSIGYMFNGSGYDDIYSKVAGVRIEKSVNNNFYSTICCLIKNPGHIGYKKLIKIFNKKLAKYGLGVINETIWNKYYKNIIKYIEVNGFDKLKGSVNDRESFDTADKKINKYVRDLVKKNRIIIIII